LKENIIKNKSFDFAVRVIGLYKYLKDEKKEYELSKQILKSGTSIGANVEEADGGISKAEFSQKLSIAYKEAKETHYWPRLLVTSGYIEKNMFDSMIKDLDEITKILFAIIKTTRINKKK
jgi:four helix bundle protein